jgi:hypothetical protein
MGLLLAIAPLVVTPAMGVLLTPLLVRSAKGLQQFHAAACLLGAQFVLVAGAWAVGLSIEDPQQNCDPYEDAAPVLLSLYVVSAVIGGVAVAAALATSREASHCGP